MDEIVPVALGRDGLAAEVIEACADERKALIGEILLRRREIEPAVEPRLHRMPIGRDDILEMARLQGAQVFVDDLIDQARLAGRQHEEGNRRRHPNEIVIDNFAFGPKTLTVAAGTTVVWVNHDDEPHTVVYSGEAKLFKSPPLDTGEKFSFVFAQKGTYNYYCSIHPHMTGTVIAE